MQKGTIKNNLKVCARFSFITLCISLALFPVSGYSKTASIAINADSGEIIHQKLANQLWYPASLTKVMTLYLIFKALSEDQIKLQDKITISKLAANQPKTRLGLNVGQTLTIEQAILAVATRSANDVAVALAEHQAKTEKNFALKMTVQAKALGMSNTLFLNATGLPNNKQVSTARDMAVLAKAIIDTFPQYYHYFSTPSFSYKKNNYSNFNPLLHSYLGADGIKTGFTCASGYNLMGSAVKKKQRLIAIVLGAKNKYARNKEMVSIFNTGFKHNYNSKQAKNIADVQAKSLKTPLNVLKSNECHKSSLLSSSRRQKMSGRTIIFGAFAEKRQARKVIKRVKAKMGLFAKYGRSTIIKRKVNGQVRWHALWTGLIIDQAGKACKKLWSAEEYCRVLHPSLLLDKNASWN